MMANFDSNGGKFHDSNEGVFYYGFGRCAIKKCFEATGVYWVRKPDCRDCFQARAVRGDADVCHVFDGWPRNGCECPTRACFFLKIQCWPGSVALAVDLITFTR